MPNSEKFTTIRISRDLLERLDAFRDDAEMGEPSRREAGDYLIEQALREEGY